MPSNMYSGYQILAAAEKGLRITPTQTGKQAKQSIVRKYKGIAKTGRYYHRGGGEWVKYSPSNDSKHKLKKPIGINTVFGSTRKAHLGDSNRKYRSKGRL